MDAKTLGTLTVHPMTADEEKNACVDGWGSTGITLRQHFAGLAMQALCSNQDWMINAHKASGKSANECVALASLEMADALLTELAKEDR